MVVKPKNALSALLAILLLLLAVACNSNAPPEEIIDSEVSQDTFSYSAEELETLAAELDRLNADEVSPSEEALEEYGDGTVYNLSEASIDILPIAVPMSIAPPVTGISINKSSDLQDAAVPAGVTPTKSYVTEAGKTYRLPDDVKKNGDIYATSNSKVLTVEKDNGRFKTIASGTAYIVVTNGAEKRYLKVTVGVGTAAAQTTVSGALDGYPVTVTDKTTPAVKVGGFKSNGVYAMYFQSADNTILGSITEDTYVKVLQIATDNGTLKGSDPVWKSGAWVAEQFNLYRGLSKESANTDGSGKVDTVAMEDEILRLTNAARLDAGLEELSPSSSANALARERAAEVATNYSHTRPDGSMVTELGYGENYTHRNTAQSAYDSWMNSPGHKANILCEGIKTTGVGVYQAQNGNVYCVQLFAY